jgi:hypothetical protein
MEFMNLVANTLGSLPAMIDWMLLQFCSRGSLFARIMKFTPLYLACSNKTDDMHAGLLNSTGIDNPKELVAEVPFYTTQRHVSSLNTDHRCKSYEHQLERK